MSWPKWLPNFSTRIDKPLVRFSNFLTINLTSLKLRYTWSASHVTCQVDLLIFITSKHDLIISEPSLPTKSDHKAYPQLVISLLQPLSNLHWASWNYLFWCNMWQMSCKISLIFWGCENHIVTHYVLLQ